MKIVLLHGWGQSSKLWSNLISQLGENATALDLPGFGNEPLVSDSWGVPEYADLVLNHISDDSHVVLLGHSFGGRIVAEIAAKRPIWLKAIILSGAPCIYRPNILTRLRISLASIGKVIVPRQFQDAFLSSDLLEARKWGLEKIFRKTVGYDQTDKLRNINVPTLLLWGEHDTEASISLAHEIQSRIRDSELKIIENCGHNAFLENPQLFYGYVNTFIKNI